MITLGWKSGNGSASRLVKGHDGETNYTVGALIQGNFGAGRDLRMGGFPLGKAFLEKGITGIHAGPSEGDVGAAVTAATEEEKNTPSTGPSAKKPDTGDGSIIVILSTDAPLTPSQLQRLVKRATVGIARVGGWGSNYSGDVFLAFSTGTQVPRDMMTRLKGPALLEPSRFVNEESMNGLFEAAADCVEESILNAICMAVETRGPLGRRVDALPYDEVREIMKDYV